MITHTLIAVLAVLSPTTIKGPLVKRIAIPVYPLELHLQGVQGEIELMVDINSSGKVINIKKISGNKEFIDCMRNVLPQWRWSESCTGFKWKVRFILDPTSKGSFNVDMYGNMDVIMPPVHENKTVDPPR